jgi:hypothetical protein
MLLHRCRGLYVCLTWARGERQVHLKHKQNGMFILLTLSK